MPPNFMVNQLHFVRMELRRCLVGVTEEEAHRRFEPMNCIAWMVGHLADQENRYWVKNAQGYELHPELNRLVGHGQPPSALSLQAMWIAWEEITTAANHYLDYLTPEVMQSNLLWKARQLHENIGTMLLRNIYHYWFHTGEAYAVRQMLGHNDLPEFVGDMQGFEYQLE
jgi:hypothetical protein